MKVLQITTHLDVGGIPNYIVSLAKALKNRGVDCLVASGGGDLERELKNSGITHKELDIRTKCEFGPKALKSIFTVSDVLKNADVDMVHAHTRVSQVVAFFACRIAKMPYVTTCHGFFKKRLRKILDTWGDKVIAISDAVKVHLEEDLGVDENRIVLIYNGVDMERFSKEYSMEEKDRIKRSLGLKEGPVIGTIGRLSPVKGQKFFIEAMVDIASKRKDCQALIAGDGEEGIRLRAMARSFGIENSVCFIGSEPDTHKFLSIMDVFVFPSIKEGLGLALLEALASGKACVASRVGGIGDVVEDGVSGLLVPVGDARAISDAVIRLLEDGALRKKMGEVGREAVLERFSLDTMADKVLQLYNEVLESHEAE